MSFLCRKPHGIGTRMVYRTRGKLDTTSPSSCGIPKEILYVHRNKSNRGRSLESPTCTLRAVESLHQQFRKIKSKISHLRKGVALAVLKNGFWVSPKFKKEMVVRAPVSLDDAFRASYFTAHEEEVANLKE